MKYAVVLCVCLDRGKVDADNDDGDVLATDLSFEQAVKMASEKMHPVAIIPVMS